MNCQPIKDHKRYHKIDCYELHTSKTPQQQEKQVLENILRVEQDTRNDVVFDVKTSLFKLTTVGGCISK